MVARSFRNELVAITDLEGGLPKRVRDRGRAIIIGKGGSGKSTILRSCLEGVTKDGGFGALIKPQSIGQFPFQKSWDDNASDVASRADLLLSELAEPKLSLDALDRLLCSRQDKWIFIDGLNEVKITCGGTDQLRSRQIGELVSRHLCNCFRTEWFAATYRRIVGLSAWFAL